MNNNNVNINYVKSILEKKYSLEDKISDKYSQIKIMKYEIELINKELYKICPHNWKPDHTFYSESTTFKCENCMLLS